MHPWGVRSAMHLFNFEKSANLKHPYAYPSDTLVCQMDGDEGAFWHMARVPKGKIKIPKGLHLDVYDITKGVFQYKDTRSSCSLIFNEIGIISLYTLFNDYTYDFTLNFSHT